MCEPLADLDYARGMELARAARWEDAQAAFRTGWAKAPRDKRFPLELGGIAFKLKDFAQAKIWLRRALRLDPADAYANEFLAALYFLDDNLEAALKYWNRASKPAIDEIRMEPEPRIDPVLLDRAFAFSRGSIIDVKDYLTTQVRIRSLGTFPRFRFELIPKEGEGFDLSFRSAERSGWLPAFAGILRGLPYRTVYPEAFNIRRSAINATSLLRWDPKKRRAYASLSSPLWRDARWRLRVYLDGRKEDWATRAGGFLLERAALGAEVRSIIDGDWTWWSGVELAHRRFRNVTLADAAQYATGGASLKYRAGLEHELLRLPEKRFRIGTSGAAEFGRLFAQSFGAFSNLQGGLDTEWFPLARGDDYRMTARLRAAKTFGPVPFDELFMLGVERDNGLWLRGHLGTHGGQKGSAPIGRDFVLSNWQIDKTILNSALFQVTLGPFLDGGRIAGAAAQLGSKRWMWDAGLQMNLRVWSRFGVILSYGRDLRSGSGAFFAAAQ